MEKRSCVVIGAGLSGLAAAYELRQKQWDVTVLEANRDRIGGRVFTFNFKQAPNLYCELGGEWVGNGHRQMKKLCEQFGLGRLLRHSFDYSFLEGGKVGGKKNGKPYTSTDWPFSKRAKDAFDKLRHEAKTWSPHSQEILDRKDWWTILRDRGFTRKELLRRDLMDSTDFGESIRLVGGFSAAAEYFSSNKSDEMDFRIKEGNSKLVDHLAAAIEGRKRRHGRILRGQKVRQIDQGGRSVRVTTTSGRRFEAAFCVCTVPARSLTNITFNPRLPDEQWDAAKQLQYARIMKTVILFDRRFWMKAKKTKFSCFTDGPSDFIFDSTLYQEDKKDRGILCSYSIGDKADDLAALHTTRPTELQRRIENDLRKIFPGAEFKGIDICAHPWQADEYTQGSYALYRPGQWFGIRAILQEPAGRVYFAGEHLADEQGFMEGALVTGQDAAANILAASVSPVLGQTSHPAIAPRAWVRRNIVH